ncbi:MAG: PQQ-dependent sugar dehydrogenase [Phycisphaerae bacterium]
MAAEQKNEHRNHKKRVGIMYARFAGMIVTASILMYIFTYLNTFSWDHVYFSEQRVYMTLTMTAMMSVVMLTFMLPMLKNRLANIGIYAASVLLFAVALWLVRSQETVQDISYMKAMIPHHSIAILTSDRAEISDPRVRELANEIRAAQRREISMMKTLINDIEEHGDGSAEKTSVTELRLGPKVPPPDASAAKVPDGFLTQVVMSGLTYPTSVEFDGDGTMYIAEAGYSYGDSNVVPRILTVSSDGKVNVALRGGGLSGPVNDLLWHDGRMYISHRGKISVLEADGKLRDLITGLPSTGDHHNNQLTVGPEGKIYFGQGTATNSGVVGLDNAKMGWLRKHPNFHDFPAKDITLTDRTFQTANPMKTTDKLVKTLPFHPFGETGGGERQIAGRTKAGGTVLRMNPDGSGLEVYAWGFRNPYGVMWSPDGTLYATENGFDVRGSRPIANDQEDVYVVKQGAWYGWPDYAMGLPVTESMFKPANKSQPKFLMAEHPPVEKPWLTFPKHSAIAKVEFSRSDSFGTGRMFVAFFGHMAPMTGKAPKEHGGHRVVRINPQTKQMETFFGKKHDGGHEKGSDGHSGDGHGESKGHGGNGGQGQSFSAGPRRLLDVRFSLDGNALYIVDFGAMDIQAGAVPVPKTGVIWRVVPEGVEASGPPENLSPPK